MIRIPLATYRMQFNPAFTFAKARDVVPYLYGLGISDLYASPVFKARAGSTHGYDVVDHTLLNPELGTVEDVEALSQELRKRSMGWMQDIVPNHMAYAPENHLLMDVLENGPQSRYIGFFDIEWNHHDESLKGKLLAPVLGSFFGECLENGEIQLEFSENGLSVRYGQVTFPLRIESYADVFSGNLPVLRKRLDRGHSDYVKLMGAFYILKNLPDSADGGERYDQIRFIKSMLWELFSTNSVIQIFIEENIRQFNGAKGVPGSFKRLSSLLADQHYRLAYWKVGVEEVNYRRFFAINDLISLKVEDPEVFKRIHELPLQLLSIGVVTGLRVDHIDGLYHPMQYLSRLRERAPDAYIAVEKILANGEPLKSQWPIQGTTGYDFLNALTGLFCMSANRENLDGIYRNFTGITVGCAAMISGNKRLLISKDLYGGLENLVYQLKTIASKFTHGSDFTLVGFRMALEEVFVHFPIYRTYINEEGADERDRQIILWTMEKARASLPSHAHEIDFIEKMLLAQSNAAFSKEEKINALEFSMRLQQFTSPLMAKGIEDTFLYVYNRLLSLNEVGGNPDIFGISAEEFHSFNRSRQSSWPHALNATSTHDTKRGEDVRARINVLSELPEAWEARITEWHGLTRDAKGKRAGASIPDRNDEYALYQILLGAWPAEVPGKSAEAAKKIFFDRLRAYLVKAVREAKVHTVWLKPDEEYEAAFLEFVNRLLNPSSDNPFLPKFLPFQRKIAFYGLFNSLSQTLLKIASPGIPDFYQGDELWDLNLVDPDNRRPVDYGLRKGYLEDMRRREKDVPGLIKDVLDNWQDGRSKFFLTYRALGARSASAPVFQNGEYLPMAAEGPRKDSVLCFARTLGRNWFIALAPRFLTSFVPEGRMPLGRDIWGETRVRLPGEAPKEWIDAISGRPVNALNSELWIGDVLGSFPAALLQGQT